MVTNGFYLNLLTPNIITELNLSFIQVTIDGPKDNHDSRRPLGNGSGTFDKIIENISIVSRYYNSITIRINVDRSNYLQVPSLLSDLKERGILNRCLYYTTPVHSDKGTCSADSCMTLQPKEWAQIDNYLYQQANKLGIVHRMYNRYPNPCAVRCSAQLRNIFVVDPEGNLYKCVTDASIKERSIYNINHKKGLNFFRAKKLRESTPFGKEECEDCQYLPLCNGGCPSVNIDWKTPGDICIDLKYSMKERLNDYVKEHSKSLGEGGGY